MHPVFVIWGFDIPAYNLFAFAAAATAAALALPALRRAGLGRARSAALLLAVCAAFLIGARLWNAAINPGNFGGKLKIYSLRMAGLSFYGGVFASCAVVIASLKLWKKPVLAGLDAMTVPGGTAFCIARIGCFLNGCCAGKATSSPFGVVFPSKAEAHKALSELFPFVSAERALHPTQLYEMLGAAAGLLLAVLLCRRLRLRTGSLFFTYCAWFSAVRLLVLPFRALSYPAAVKAFFYPALYAGIILTGIYAALRLNGTPSGTTP